MTLHSDDISNARFYVIFAFQDSLINIAFVITMSWVQMSSESAGFDSLSLGPSNISARLLQAPVPGNQSVYGVEQSQVVTSLMCDASPVYCSVKWLAIVMVVEIAFGIGKRLQKLLWYTLPFLQNKRLSTKNISLSLINTLHCIANLHRLRNHITSFSI